MISEVQRESLLGAPRGRTSRRLSDCVRTLPHKRHIAIAFNQRPNYHGLGLNRQGVSFGIAELQVQNSVFLDTQFSHGSRRAAGVGSRGRKCLISGGRGH